MNISKCAYICSFLPLIALTGCGSNGGDSVVPSELEAGAPSPMVRDGEADAQLPDAKLSDAGAADTTPLQDASPDEPSPAPTEIPFDQAFSAPTTVACKQDGLLKLSASLVFPKYQLSNCEVRLRASSRVAGRVGVTLLQPTGSWSAKTVADVVDPQVQVVSLQGGDPADKAVASIDLRFDFATTDGKSATTTLTMARATETDLVSYESPHVAEIYSVDTPNVLYPPRLAGPSTVVRRGEMVSLAAPFTLPMSTKADTLGGSFTVQAPIGYTGDPCFFGQLWPRPGTLVIRTQTEAGWRHADGLRITSSLYPAIAADADCVGLPLPPLFAGTATFDGMLGVVHSAPVSLRFVEKARVTETRASSLTSADGALVGLHVTNNDDFELHSLKPSVTFACEGGAALTTETFVEISPPPVDVGAGELWATNIAPGQDAVWSPDVLQKALRAEIAAEKASCASHRWTIAGLRVLEHGGVVGKAGPLAGIINE